MKYILRILCIFILLMLISPYKYAIDTNSLVTQQEELNISSFIKETEKYTKNIDININVNNIFNSAIKGKIDNNAISSKILNIFGKEIKETITILR